MPQPDFVDPASDSDLIDPAGEDIPAEPLPPPPVTITVIPGQETDEELGPGEENFELEVSITNNPS